MSYVITVNDLSKRYILSHKRETRYTTLRDVLSQGAKQLYTRIVSEKDQLSEEFWALKDVNFNIHQGDRVGVIGRNGAGKSTLLKILSRITDPTTGRVTIRGRVSSLLEVGTGFHPELTGRENIFLNGAILGMSRTEILHKFDEIVSFAEVEKFLDTPVKRYSSGMYVRLAFAVAAHIEPEILIVDEVLAVGDAQFQKKCLGKMEEVGREGRTVLFVSHNMGAIRALCGQALLLHQGKLLANGAVEDVISEYARNFQAASRMEVEFEEEGDENLDARPLRLRFLGRENNSLAQFKIGEPWIVELEFQISNALRSVIAAIGVVTLDGIPVVTCWSVAEDLESGRYRARFTVDETFRSREFTISVGLTSMGHSLYFRENCATVSVSEVAESQQPFRTTGAPLLAGSQKAKIERIN